MIYDLVMSHKKVNQVLDTPQGILTLAQCWAAVMSDSEPTFKQYL